MQQNENDPVPITLESLVWQESFRNWVLHPSVAQNLYWQQWQNQHPAQADTLTQAREVVLALNVKNRPITDADIQVVIAITRQQLDRPADAPVRQLRHWERGWQMVATVALLLMAGGGFWWVSRPAPVATLPMTTTVPTGLALSARPGIVQLADGSTVRLGKQSQLRFPRQFAANQREVYLTGEATFLVRRRPDQPFLVHANGSVTRVLGTQFTIKALAGASRVTIRVLSGKVSVLPESEWARAQRQAGYQPQTVIVTPNQQVVFERTRERMSKSLVPNPVVQQPAAVNRFNFVQTPVSEVLRTLEDAYGIPIVFDAGVLQQCVVTAPLANEPLFDKLDIICETIGARYEVVEAQIIISGKGCAM